MDRAALLSLLDGTHPRFGRKLAFAIQALIILSGLIIALETVEGLPNWTTAAFIGLETMILAAFAAEYIARVLCTPRPLSYIFSFWGLVDLLAFLPALTLMQPQWAAIRVFRLLRLVRLLKLFRTSRALDRFNQAFRDMRGELGVFLALAAMTLYVASVGIFIFEHPAQPDVFTSIPKSLWWAIATFSTVGYGDMVPVTLGGRVFTSLILVLGLGIVAVPVAIVTTALVNSDAPPQETDDDAGGGTNRPVHRPKF